MPPPNTTPATATVIPSIPYVNVQSDIHDAGTTFTVWYKRISDGTEGLVGEMFRGAGAYTPTCEVYIDDEFTLLGTISANRMSQTPLLSGRTYLFKVIPNGGNPNPAVLTVNLVKQPRNGFNSGDIFIRAASILPSFQSAGYGGLAGGIINPVTGVIKDFDPVFQVGESGDYLRSGELCFADEYTSPFDKIRIYRPTLPLTEKAVVTFDWNSSFPIIRTSREQSVFYIGDKGFAGSATPVGYFTIDANGNTTPVVRVTAGNFGLTAMANSHDNLFVYMAGIGGSVGAAIKKWNKAGNAFDADFAAGVANHIVQDILVMKNGQVIALYHQSATDSIFARIYSSAGAIIATYTVTIPASGFTSIAPRLGYANDDSVTFWIFPHGSDGFSYFKQVNVADGSLVREFTTPDSSYFGIDQGATPTFRLVTSDSCPFVLMLGIEGGIFSVTPTTEAIPSLRRDRYYNNLDKKIPNPTVRTALIGD